MMFKMQTGYQVDIHVENWKCRTTTEETTVTDVELGYINMFRDRFVGR